MKIKIPKRFLLVSYLSLAGSGLAHAADVHPLEQTTGLKRFDATQRLTISQDSRSTLDIKSLYIGDNALASAMSLYDQGAKLHHIAGSTRSDKVRLSFYQPYQNSRLEQRLELNFNKFNGFITKISSLYTVESAYVGIKDVLNDVLTSAIAKYGNPLSIESARQQAGVQQGDVPLNRYIKTLEPRVDIAAQVTDYFQDLRVSLSAKLVNDDKGYALLHSGFNRCYIWQTQSYNEILTLCSFDPAAANAANRGVELSLVDFAVQKKIAATEKINSELSLTL
ncbi:hypothetical protein [Paraglaciecola polaris]|uniref:Uncharacterized protein n=1 Tax=Paraglaciecola polaris LMG 21857 TaxID=1129793 RepID=K7A0H6_9ALTE|nr:hypothetical protein [Paraglaciecola polaris]GAC34458.1 hypothetical protein GPLA_3570 [Paraglaciecola polaris LMG 21857]|tara:strand:- start:847 stop:1686 length:840 start_codon:yes stop_codon:yes gene_type:complete